MPQPILIRQKQYVSVAHRYWDSRWDEAQNRRRYGRQASPQGVGSNMLVEIGKYGAQPSELASASLKVKQLLDHRCLFTEISEFEGQASTLERVCLYLQKNLPPLDWLRVEENSHLACQAGPRGLRLEVDVMNLRLSFSGPMGEDGQIFEREQVTQAVINEYKSERAGPDENSGRWAEKLYTNLAQRLPVDELRIDLGRQRYILVKSKG